MTDYISYDVVAGTAFLTITNPPVNALARAVRVELAKGLERAARDPEVQEIVLAGDGVTFPAGAELGELNKTPDEMAPFLREICNQVEQMDKPVLAVLHGTVFGGGLELALAAHYRLAQRGTRFSLPEIKLGIVAGAGATQRLPRLVGAAHALDLLLDALVVTVDADKESPLVDGIFEGDPKHAAASFCKQLRASGQGPRRLSDRRDGFEDMHAYMEAIKSRRAALDPQNEAAGRIVDLVEAAPMLPFEIGVAMEEDAHDTSLTSEESQALRHSFLVEHKARRAAAPAEKPKIETLAVLGAGPLAMQIALSALNAGLRVQWGARDPDRLSEGSAQIRSIFDKGVQSGGLSADRAEQRLALMSVGDSEEMAQGADMILHAARGQGDVPAPRHVVRAVAMAGRVDQLGLRFLPPVYTSKLVEIVQGPDATPHQIASAVALAERMGKVPVIVSSQGDSIAGRLAAALQHAADGLVDIGANPYTVDAALGDWGWKQLPFQTRDLTGLEVMAARHNRIGHNWSEKLMEIGRKGWVSGAGFYDWEQDKARPSEVVPRLINGTRPPVDWDAGDILRLLVAGLANEGTRLLLSGMARSAADIDLVSIHAQEFPKTHGGVMKTASQLGLANLCGVLERCPHPDRGFWQPTPMWRELFKNGRDFGDV